MINEIHILLAKNSREHSTLIILAPTDQVEKTVPFLRMEQLEKAILAIIAKRLSRGRKRDYLQIGKLGNNATMRAISILVYTALSFRISYIIS